MADCATAVSKSKYQVLNEVENFLTGTENLLSTQLKQKNWSQTQKKFCFPISITAENRGSWQSHAPRAPHEPRAGLSTRQRWPREVLRGLISWGAWRKHNPCNSCRSTFTAVPWSTSPLTASLYGTLAAPLRAGRVSSASLKWLRRWLAHSFQIQLQSHEHLQRRIPPQSWCLHPPAVWQIYNGLVRCVCTTTVKSSFHTTEISTLYSTRDASQ